MNLYKSIEHHSEKLSDNNAIVFEGQRISYAELDKSVNKVACGLKSLGILEHDRVAIMLPNIPEFIYLFYACQKIGAIAVTVNIMYKGNEVKHILKDSGAKAIACLTNSLATINEIIPDLPKLEHVIITGERTITFADPQGTVYLQSVLKKSEYKDLDVLYRFLGESIVDTLKKLGINDVWYKHRGGVRHKDGGKIAGVLIYEIDDLYIANILVFTSEINFDDFLSVVWVPSEIRDKVTEPITPINSLISQEFNINGFIQNFISVIENKAGVNFIEGKMSREEHFAYEKQKALCKKIIKKNSNSKNFMSGIISTLFRKGGLL